MTVRYDPEADAAYIRLKEAAVRRTEEDSDVCILDFDEQGELVAIELLSVFGFAGASLQALARKGLITGDQSDRLLRELRTELVPA